MATNFVAATRYAVVKYVTANFTTPHSITLFPQNEDQINIQLASNEHVSLNVPHIEYYSGKAGFLTILQSR